MSAYYNENDPKTADWLRELIRQKLIAEGEVDDRSIRSVEPADLRGYSQCHFFAGIGGWAHALDLAGWGQRPVWTGSCPCQPFSLAGTGAGLDDERHLWPIWYHLIRECQPPVVFGEQVASPAGLSWYDLVQADLEGAGYACGAADLCAPGLGAPHIRQRLYFVAHALGQRLRGSGHRANGEAPSPVQGADRARERLRSDPGASGGEPHGVAHALPAGRPQGWSIPGSGSLARGGEPHLVGDPIGAQRAGTEELLSIPGRPAGIVAHPERGGGHDGRGRATGRAAAGEGREAPVGGSDRQPAEEHGAADLMADPLPAGRPQGRAVPGGGPAAGSGEPRGLAVPLRPERGSEPEGRGDVEHGGHAGGEEAAGGRSVGGEIRRFWDSADWLPCRDGKARPVEPGTFPLAHGLPARMVRLRGYGNAIVPQVAAEFIKASLGWEENQ